MKSLLLICLFFSIKISFGQSFIPIDTSNVEYRRSLKNLYSKRVAEQEIIFKQNISDPKISKEVASIYNEVSTGFLETIDKGQFVDSPLYREQLDAILDKLKNGNPEYPTLANTKILLSHGAMPNAYAIGNDIIVLYIPLIKKVRNEYELASIISHEIAHNILNHSYNGMTAYASLKQSEEIKQKTKELKRQKYNRAGEAIALYKKLVYGSTKNSRKLEREADSLGYILYKNAFKGFEYEVVESLVLLETIDEERDSLVLPEYISLFQTDLFPFKEEWVNNDVLNRYKYDNTPKFWTVDSLKTHLDGAIRAEFIKSKFNVKQSDLHEASDGFKAIQFASKYNDLLGLYSIKEYGRSLYETLLLLKNEPGNNFLRNMVHENLLRIQEAQKDYTLDRHLDRPHPRNSESYNSFLYFIRDLRRKELNNIINQYKA